MDIEKVIKEWESVLGRDPLDVQWDLIDETLALLKEQEAVEPTKNEDGELFCGNCGDHIGTEPHSPELPVLIMNYCPSCGRRVKKQNIPIHKDWWVK